MQGSKSNIVQTRSRGTMQTGRMLPALDPDYVPVDGKTLAQNIDFLYGFSDLVKLVDTSNAVSGSWNQMLQQDDSFTLASIATVSLGKFPPLYAQATKTLNGNTSVDKKAVALSWLFAYTDMLATNLALWVIGSPNEENDPLGIYQTLSQLIATFVGNRLNSWQACLDLMVTILPVNPSKVTGMSLFDDVGSVTSALTPVLPALADQNRPQVKFTTSEDCAVYLSDLYLGLYRCNVQVHDQLSGKLNASLRLPNHEPHNALLLAFQQMLATSQAAMNTLTKRHLDFYYERVLQLEPQPPIASTAFVQFALAKGTTTAVVPAQTLLTAGKGPSGAMIVFATDSELVLNLVTITQFMTVYNSSVATIGTCAGLLNASPVANSGDGQGGAFPANAPAEWPPFGFAPTASAPGAAPTLVGFALADPVLLMSTGARTLSLAFTLQDADAAAIIDALSEWLPPVDGGSLPSDSPFSLSYTGPKGWVTVTSWQFLSSPGAHSAVPASSPPTNACLWLDASLDVNAVSIVDYDPTLHGPGYVAGMPVWRFEVNAAQGSDGKSAKDPLQNPYNLLQQVAFTAIDILVTVQGKTDLALQNDYTVLNPQKPFQPLGSATVLDSSLYIGSPEAFRKQLTALSVQLTWMQLPTTYPTGFAGYYKIWNQVAKEVLFSNIIFRVSVSILQQNNWALLPPKPGKLSAPSDFQLYELGPSKAGGGTGSYDAMAWLVDNGWLGDQTPPNPEAPPVVNQVLQSTTTLDDFDLGVINASITQIPASSIGTTFPYVSGLPTGFLKLSLTAPVYGFGTPIYNDMVFGVNQQNIESISTSAKGSPGSTPTIIAPPALPYVPTAKSLSIDYSATGSFVVGGQNAGYFLMLQPFGITLPSTSGPSLTLLPPYAAEGSLYMGLANVNAPQLLSILVQLDENTAVAQAGVPLPVVNWSYLQNEAWVPFQKSDIVSDGTDNFSKSGIVQLMLNVGPAASYPPSKTAPVQAQGGWFNSVAGYADLLWISAVVGTDTAATCKVIMIGTQAVNATYQIGPDAATVLAQPLAAGSITKMQTPITGVGSVTQPMDAVGGRIGETDAQFYTRVHERLRHKDRGITPWDIEHILLEDYPDVGLVNCFAHSSPTDDLVPGACLVVVFPGGALSGQPNPYSPKFTLASIEAMQSTLSALIPADMDAVVSNPGYETITVNASVGFMPGLDPGTCLIQLNSDLCNYISPWVAAPGICNPYDTLLSNALIRGFINGLSYVQQLASLQVLHTVIVDGQPYTRVEHEDFAYYQPTSPFAILTSPIQHILRDMHAADGGPTLVVTALAARQVATLGNAVVQAEIGSPMPALKQEYLSIPLG